MNINKIKNSLPAFTAFFYITAIFLSLPQNVQASDVKTLVEKVIERNYDLKQARSFTQQASDESKLAQSMIYPKLSFEMSLVRSDDPVFAFGSYLRQGRFSQSNFDIDKLNSPGPVDDFTASVSAGIPIYTAGKIAFGIKNAKTNIARSGQQEIMTRNNIMMSVLERYFAALRFKETAASSIDAEKFAKSEINDARALTAHGMAPGAEYYGAEAVARSVSAARIESESGYENAAAALAIMAGETQIYFSSDTKIPEKEYFVEPLENLTAKAVEMRSDINIARLQQSTVNDALGVEKNNALPSVHAFGKIQTDSYDTKYMPGHYTVGVQLSMPLFDQSHSFKVNMAEEQFRQSNINLSSIKEQTSIEVSNAYINYKSSIKALKEMRDAKKQAEKSVKMMRVLYKQGKVSVIDILRAEEQFLSVQAAFFKAAYNMNTAYVSLMYVSGQLSLETVKTINDAIQEARQ
jgi:outer membrane protein TolC